MLPEGFSRDFPSSGLLIPLTATASSFGTPLPVAYLTEVELGLGVPFGGVL